MITKKITTDEMTTDISAIDMLLSSSTSSSNLLAIADNNPTELSDMAKELTEPEDNAEEADPRHPDVSQNTPRGKHERSELEYGK